MSDIATPSGHQDLPLVVPTYQPPTITYLGDLANLTQKTVGGADGQTFLGLSIDS